MGIKLCLLPSDDYFSRFSFKFKVGFGHFGEPRDRFSNDWFRWFFERIAMFENITQQDPVNSSKQPL
jgi:hypothetical protein